MKSTASVALPVPGLPVPFVVLLVAVAPLVAVFVVEHPVVVVVLWFDDDLGFPPPEVVDELVVAALFVVLAVAVVPGLLPPGELFPSVKDLPLYFVWISAFRSVL